ncbi:MAG: polysaccharide biosynthesis tyrosine autokinase [Chloroflexota bacterium]
MTTVLAAAAIGFSLAVAAAYLLEYLDDTVKTPADIQRAVSLPTLTAIAEYRPDKRATSPLVTIVQPRTPISEAYRGLRTAIQFGSVDDPIRTLLVTSATPSEGKSFTAANLVVVMAQAGNRVLLLDADLRKPVQNRLMGMTRHYGLTDLLLARSIDINPEKPGMTYTHFKQAIVETEQPYSFFIASGSIPPNPAELVGSTKLKSLLNILARGFDYVVIDSPPVLAVTDAVILSTRVDRVLLVARAGQTRRNQLKQALSRLEDVNANVMGVVLNRLNTRSREYAYDYYYNSHNSSYFHDDPDSSEEELEQLAGRGETQASGKTIAARPSFITRLLGRPSI